MSNKYELTEYNLFVKEHMQRLCAIEKKKGSKGKHPNEVMAIVAKMWQKQKKQVEPSKTTVKTKTTEYIVQFSFSYYEKTTTRSKTIK